MNQNTTLPPEVRSLTQQTAQKFSLTSDNQTTKTRMFGRERLQLEGSKEQLVEAAHALAEAKEGTAVAKYIDGKLGAAKIHLYERLAVAYKMLNAVGVDVD